MSRPAAPAGLHLWQYRAAQDVFWFAAAAGLVAFGYHVRSVVTPLLVALALAYVVQPLVVAARRRLRVPPLASVAVLSAVAVTLAVAAAWFVGPPIAEELRQFRDNAPRYVERLRDAAPFELSDVPGDPKTSEVLGAVGDASAAGASLIGAGLSAAAYYSVWTLLLPVFFFLFAVRFDETLRSFERFIPTRYRDETRRLASKMDEVVGGYIRGRLVAVAFLCCGFSLGWRLVGVPYALSLGVATGVLGAVPWLAAIGWPISVALKAASVESGSIDWVTVFGLPTLVYFAVQIVENYVVTPWVQSAAMGLSPTAVLVVVLIGGAVGGAYGLLLALPAAGCLRVLASEVIFPRLEAWADSA